jgi:hypothetical protein
MSRELIGHVDVDSGSVWIGDPCYIVKGEEWHGVSRAYLDALNEGRVYVKLPHKLGHEGMGIMAGTLYGDGTYPVYAEFDRNGGIKSLTIDFEQEDEEEENE